jgi:hypothetical protein
MLFQYTKNLLYLPPQGAITTQILYTVYLAWLLYRAIK